MSGTQVLAVNSDWLNGCDTVTSGGSALSHALTYGSSTNAIDCYPHYWPYWSYPVYVSSPSRPIKLTLSEIEKLRKAARADKAIQAILAKFTDQIEITVDFA